MIGAAHVTTTRDIHAARADRLTADGFARFEMPEHPTLTIESVFRDTCETLTDWARVAREDMHHA